MAGLQGVLVALTISSVFLEVLEGGLRGVLGFRGA